MTLPQKISDFYILCKPKVVFLMLITTWVGMVLSIPFSHVMHYLKPIFYGTIGISSCAFSAAALNHLIDQHWDRRMHRTQSRPIAAKRLSNGQALCFAAILACFGTTLLWFQTNLLTTLLTLGSLFGYAVLYTIFLKHATPQNIVIGGISGALPPLLGWVALTGEIAPLPLFLVLIIFIWTPPHFWALSIFRAEDYRKAAIPMLPITHGIPFTQLSILLYSILLAVISLMPYLLGLTYHVYGISALLLNVWFIYWAYQQYRASEPAQACKKLFIVSIQYLFLLFIALILDKMSYELILNRFVI